MWHWAFAVTSSVPPSRVAHVHARLDILNPFNTVALCVPWKSWIFHESFLLLPPTHTMICTRRENSRHHSCLRSWASLSLLPLVLFSLVFPSPAIPSRRVYPSFTNHNIPARWLHLATNITVEFINALIGDIKWIINERVNHQFTVKGLSF